MKRNLAGLFAAIGWFAVVLQFILMVQNSDNPIAEIIIRFFSFFTILTNTIVAIYFTGIFFAKKDEVIFFTKPGILTAITIYITLVCLVYQVALRHIWTPVGLQKLVDELLHSVIPILVIIFWYKYETITVVKYTQILKWAIFPLLYLFYVLIRGNFSKFYPYPFIDVTNIGFAKTISNATMVLILFLVISSVFLFVGKKLIKR